jgi:hypothetical protein
MPTANQYAKEITAKKLRALAEYEKRKAILPNAERLCERCIRLELKRTEKRQQKYKADITFGEYLIDWK